jgi:hypothetical protein
LTADADAVACVLPSGVEHFGHVMFDALAELYASVPQFGHRYCCMSFALLLRPAPARWSGPVRVG